MENDEDVEYASGEYYIKQGICNICGASLCAECDMCPAAGHSDDCPTLIAKGETKKCL